MGNDISLYRDEVAKPADIAKEIQLLKYSFPDITEEFTAVLMDRIFANRFTKQRIHDAVGFVLDNFHYKNLNIADIISFDRKVKSYTYGEMTALCTPYRTTESFEMIVLNGKKLWVEK